MVRSGWFIILCFICSIANAGYSDTLIFQGQLSCWSNININNGTSVWLGGRYIPQISYRSTAGNRHGFFIEASSNINGMSGFDTLQEFTYEGSIKLYRLWARYTIEQFEFRLGLQKINFGSANLLRPLMWFDKVDPRDPLQLTDGVWGVLGRYYFLNNANIWLWGLYGNEGLKSWEVSKGNTSYPEFGGRIQHPVPAGEAAFTFHHRVADLTESGFISPEYSEISENRVGVDAKWDIGPGIWIEGFWVNKAKKVGLLTNRFIGNIGIDYTFGVGNGITATCEYLFYSAGESLFGFEESHYFSALSVTYPVSFFDNINSIVFFDWKNKHVYSFLNWRKQLNTLSFYLMVFWNPATYLLPVTGNGTNIFGGKGIQFMIVYQH